MTELQTSNLKKKKYQNVCIRCKEHVSYDISVTPVTARPHSENNYGHLPIQAPNCIYNV